jgi:protocatechuate 3,4-dioxygenase alpha subunit
MRHLTPFQTIGPFFHGALVGSGSGWIAEPLAGGTRVQVRGHVWDGARAPVADALLEVWQADPAGRFAGSADTGETGPHFHGFGRFATDSEGAFRIDTVLPGATPGPEGSTQAPHLLVQVFARGLLSRLITRIYFDGEALNEKDPILACVPRERRHTLIARRSADAEYRFDLVLQGADETVFFDV